MLSMAISVYKRTKNSYHLCIELVGCRKHLTYNNIGKYRQMIKMKIDLTLSFLSFFFRKKEICCGIDD
jgi:hypothetical protein